ncbi:MAG: penicillin-binding protein 2 [Candidatus Omnitrophota bacterium]|nr:penicillin-binding protein 2 [Candidatus Omnitrophota bacterium]
MDETYIRRFYLGGFLILLGVLFFYQVLRGGYFFDRAENNYVRVIPLRSLRGDIFDRNSKLLTSDIPSYNLAVIPYQIKKNKDAILAQIATGLKQPPRTVERAYRRRFRNMFSPVDIAVDLKKTDILELKERLKNLVVINPQPQRHYYYPYVNSHLLGYVKEAASFYEELKKYGYSPLERVGFMGVEQYYDSYLRGEDGGNLIEVNARGRIVGFLGQRQPTKGKDIYLTIDARMQEIAYAVLEGRRGALVLMDSETGEILAFVSSPGFDANNFTKGKDLDAFFHDTNKPLLNRITQARYPLGSTFKPVVALAALEMRKITPATSFVCKGSLSVGGAEFRCLGNHGSENMYAALMHSCNVYFYNVGKITGADAISRYARIVGLASMSGIDIPYEKKGSVPEPGKIPRSWFMGDTINLSIGQGYLESTPLSALIAMNVFASGGYLVKPHLLKSVAGIEVSAPTKTNLTLSASSLEAITQGLVDAVEKQEGTAHPLADLNLKIAGKTGTAQTRGAAHGWFLGFFPYNQPRYTICVFMENAGSSHEAVKVTHVFLKALQEEKKFKE